MMQRIECMNCGDIVELTGDSVTLPFVCKECTEAAEFQEKITPTLKDYAENPTLVSALEKAGYRLVPLDQQLADLGPKAPVQIEGGPVPPAEEEHNEATVENTTLLIEDLEKQLSDTTDELGRSNLLIVDLKDENNDLKQVVSNLVKANLTLYAERNEARESVGSLIKVCCFLEESMRKAIDSRRFWQEATFKANQRAEWANRRRREVFKELMFYKYQGFFGRLFGREYQA